MSTRRGYFPFAEPAHGTDVQPETSGGTVVRAAVASQPAYRVPYYYTLTVPNGVTGLAAVSFGRRRAAPMHEHADVAVRVKITAGNTEATGRVSLALGRGVEEGGDPIAVTWGGWGSLTDQMLVVSMLGNGTLELGSVTDGSYASIATGATFPSSGQRTADRGVWLRVVRTTTHVAIWWGVADGTQGDDALPKRWNCSLVSSAVAALTDSSFMQTLRVSVETSAGIVGGFAVRVLDAAWLGPWASGMGLEGLEPDTDEPPDDPRPGSLPA